MSKFIKSDLAETMIGNRSVHLTDNDARELQRLLRLLGPPETGTAVRKGDAAAPRPFQTDDVHQAATAVLRSRLARKTIFASSIFGEPAWDMLLTLYVGESEGMRLTVSRLAELSDARLTTAIRWIEYLDQAGLIVRRAHPNDARVVLIELTAQAIEKMERYFELLLQAGYVA